MPIAGPPRLCVRPARAWPGARRHRNSRLAYTAGNVLSLALPRALHRARGRGLLADAASLPPEQLARVDHYYRVPGPFTLGPTADALPLARLKRRSNYWFDLSEHLRRLPAGLRLHYRFGDKTHAESVPTIVKARRIGEPERTSVLMKLDRVRHFLFVDDARSFGSKRDSLVWRGAARNQEQRRAFLARWHAHPWIDAGRTDGDAHAPHRAPFLSIDQQLEHKFVLSIEGNDVATNLKWILSSNSVCVMPRPTKETWFMESLLEPGVQYLEVRDDFEDLEEVIERALRDEAGCRRIVERAHAWVDRFRDRRVEDTLALLVLERYFRDSGQL